MIQVSQSQNETQYFHLTAMLFSDCYFAHEVDFYTLRVDLFVTYILP